MQALLKLSTAIDRLNATVGRYAIWLIFGATAISAIVIWNPKERYSGFLGLGATVPAGVFAGAGVELTRVCLLGGSADAGGAVRADVPGPRAARIDATANRAGRRRM